MPVYLEDLHFADNICLLMHRESADKNGKMCKLMHYACQGGLKMTVAKTKLMCARGFGLMQMLKLDVLVQLGWSIIKFQSN